MQDLGLENNLAETVFFVPSTNPEADYDIRWFTPQVEINLCGHATLASAYVLFEILGNKKEEIIFNSKSGLLKVSADKSDATAFKGLLDFPSWKPALVHERPEYLSEIFGNTKIISVYKNRDLLIELENENAVKNYKPDFTLMKKYIDKMIITARGNEVDFVSRFFAPGAGIDEDPVTGSAHSQLIPYWSEKLNKKKMFAKQFSSRGGELWCEQLNEQRVSIGGQCVFYMKGEINL
jgi:PhzF family phenazine biosynthesis protein